MEKVTGLAQSRVMRIDDGFSKEAHKVFLYDLVDVRQESGVER